MTRCFWRISPDVSVIATRSETAPPKQQSSPLSLHWSRKSKDPRLGPIQLLQSETSRRNVASIEICLFRTPTGQPWQSPRSLGIAEAEILAFQRLRVLLLPRVLTGHRAAIASEGIKVSASLRPAAGERQGSRRRNPIALA